MEYGVEREENRGQAVAVTEIGCGKIVSGAGMRFRA